MDAMIVKDMTITYNSSYKDQLKGNLYIPSKYNGEPIIEIGNNALYRFSYITTITIQEGIRIIGERAFYYCYSVKEIQIPDSVREVYQIAFDCSPSGDFPDSPIILHFVEGPNNNGISLNSAVHTRIIIFWDRKTSSINGLTKYTSLTKKSPYTFFSLYGYGPSNIKLNYTAIKLGLEKAPCPDALPNNQPQKVKESKRTSPINMIALAHAILI